MMSRPILTQEVLALVHQTVVIQEVGLRLRLRMREVLQEVQTAPLRVVGVQEVQHHPAAVYPVGIREHQEGEMEARPVYQVHILEQHLLPAPWTAHPRPDMISTPECYCV